MLRFIAEQGQTLYMELGYNDENDTLITPDTFEAVVTEQATNTIVQTITTYDVISVGTLGILIDTSTWNVGRHFVNCKATKGTYHQEDVFSIDIQNHEGK